MGREKMDQICFRTESQELLIHSSWVTGLSRGLDFPQSCCSFFRLALTWKRSTINTVTDLPTFLDYDSIIESIRGHRSLFRPFSVGGTLFGNGLASRRWRLANSCLPLAKLPMNEGSWSHKPLFTLSFCLQSVAQLRLFILSSLNINWGSKI